LVHGDPPVRNEVRELHLAEDLAEIVPAPFTSVHTEYPLDEDIGGLRRYIFFLKALPVFLDAINRDEDALLGWRLNA
jgi:hypothetical protein